MAKSKSKRRYPLTVEIHYLKINEENEVTSGVAEISVKKSFISYEDLVYYYQLYIEEKGEILKQEVNFYVPDYENLRRQKRITEGFQLDVEKSLEKNGVLILIIRNKLFQYKKEFDEKIQFIQEELYEVKDKCSALQQNLMQSTALLKKTSFNNTGNNFLTNNISIYEQQSSQVELDIAILFSQPLEKPAGKSKTNAPPPVDFRSEIQRLNQSFRNSHKPQISMRCQIATAQKLRHIVQKQKPKILHIICHGNQQGFLQFQDDSRVNLGLCKLFGGGELKSLLEDCESLPDLVFINSCHSQKIGEVFFQIGIRNVIMINSEDTVTDIAAQQFSEMFYRNIFKGQKVSISYQRSKEDVDKNFKSSSCCCMHSSFQPHRKNCLWQPIRNASKINAHRNYHVPSTKCKCTTSRFNVHQLTCQWAKKTLFEINLDFRIENDGELRFPHYSEYPSYVELKDGFRICCCPPEKGIPHSECQKFKILQRNSDQKIFNIENANNNENILDYTSASLLETHLKEKNLFGRQKEMYYFLSEVAQKNIIILYGEEGVGLTSFAIKSAAYMTQRRVFQFSFFIDIYDIRDITVFKYKFHQITKIEFGSAFQQTTMRRKKILFIIDNCDDLMKTYPKQFHAEIFRLLRELPEAKIILIIKSKTFQKLKQRLRNFHIHELKPLEKRVAANLLNLKLKDKTDISVGNQEMRKLVDKYEILKIPKNIQNLSHILGKQGNFKIERLTKQLDKVSQNDSSMLLENSLDKLSKKNTQVYQFLIFVSQFSEGVSYQDLQMFSTYDQTNENNQATFDLPIKMNWEQHLNFLCQDDEESFKKEDKQEYIPKPKPPLLKYSQTQYKDQISDTSRQEMLSEANMEKNQKKEKVKQSIENMRKQKSYFFQKTGQSSFIVKRFIRDYVWNRYQRETRFKMQLLFVSYFSVILELLFKSLKADNYIHEELLTYSQVSQAGLFSFSTDLDSAYEGRSSLTESTKFAKDVRQNIDKIFTNNEALIKKLKKNDPSDFIMNHRQDFFKIYDNNWCQIIQQYDSSQQSVYICLLENLMILIPTAFKVANAENSLVQFVRFKSERVLNQISQLSAKKQRTLQLFLKIKMIQIGLKIGNKQEYDHVLRNMNEKISFQTDSVSVLNAFHNEEDNIRLYSYLYAKPSQLDDIFHEQVYKIFFQERRGSNEEIIEGKKYLLLGLNVLNMLNKIRTEMQNFLHKKQDFQNLLLKKIKDASQIFKKKTLKKLQLRAKLTQIKLTWQFEKIKSKQSHHIESITKLIGQLKKCSDIYHDPPNRLRGFPEFDSDIKQLEFQMKKKLWKTTKNTLVFMRAFPLLSGSGKPLVSNLVRKKNPFRKDLEKIFQQKYPDTERITSKHYKRERKDSYLQDSVQLDISAKFQILRKKKLQQELDLGCSVMVISGECRGKIQRPWLICEGDMMNQEPIEINSQFAEKFNIEKVNILVISGSNAKTAAQKIQKLSSKPPIIIALSYEDERDDSSDEQAEENLVDSTIKQNITIFKKIRQQNLSYIKFFVETIIKSKITDIQTIRRIHQDSVKKLRQQEGIYGIEPIIFYEKCEDFQLSYTRGGSYQDLSPGYQKNHNIEFQKFYNVVRRYKQLKQLFLFLHDTTHCLQVKEPTDIFFDKKQKQATLINVYGEDKSGKTYFIKEVARELVEREMYDVGVYYFDGGKIESQHSGEFQKYIRQEGKRGKMPVLDDFERLLSQKTVIIIDDFYKIKPRVNARLNMFIQKLIKKKVTLIFVSIKESKGEWWQKKAKKIKVQKLSKFQLDVFAHSILNMQKKQHYEQYETLKHENKVTAKAILDIKDERRNYHPRPVVEFKKFQSFYE